MSEIYVISDTHFNHKNIIGYCQRPFQDVTDMNEHMIDRWNKIVTPQDKIYHLGDVYMNGKGMDQLLSRLNGKKRLILGNHDNGKDQILLKHFQKIGMWRVFKEFGLLLTHVPVHAGSIRGGGVNVHGHIHNQPSPEGPYKCVCVEQTDYMPVNIETLRVK